LEEDNPEAEYAANLEGGYDNDERNVAIGPDESPPFHSFPYPPIHSSTPLDFGQLLDDTATSYKDSAIGGREEVPLPFDSAAASLAAQSQFYCALLDRVELLMEGANQAF
jgi:hypothetical protein